MALKYVSTLATRSFHIQSFRLTTPLTHHRFYSLTHRRPIKYSIRKSPKFSPEEFPPLPTIDDPEIEKQVFTHRSLFGRSAAAFEDPDDGFHPDNETLEFLGDSIVGLVTTELIREMFPRLRVGPLSKVKSLLVNNENLAVICDRYGLHHKLKTAASQVLVLRESSNVKGDLFEAYVGGLYLKKGMDVPRTWLRTIIRPFAEEAIAIVKREHLIKGAPASPKNDANDDNSTSTSSLSTIQPSPLSGAPDSAILSLFNQHCSKKNSPPTWDFGPVSV
ncbi:hypothetical protein FRC02_004171 [Tulasnella sp. 418]|nr:hypothetical protein FRC02_004171 [Tulasnella sp. 418]